jgi:O-antigen ligase
MNSQRIHISNFDKLTILIVGLCASLFPLLFLTLRGWTNACLFLAGLASIIYICIKHPRFYKNKSKTYWLLLSALCAPFITELLAQILRGHIHMSSLDGPIRFLIASFIYVAIVEMPNKSIQLNLEWFIPTSLLICLAAYFLNPDASQFWGGRAASYFADPITFASYITALSFICLIYLRKSQSIALILLLLTAFASGIYLVVESQSRSAWTSYLIIGPLIPLINGKISKKIFAASLLVIICSAFSAYYFDSIVKHRIDLVYSEIMAYFNGNRETSIGIRISLARIDMYLFFNYLFTGIQDGILPPVAELSRTQNYMTESLYSMKLAWGSHNEILAQLSRKGIWGIASILGLFMIPITFFFRKMADLNQTTSTLAKVGFVFCTSIFISSLTIQVFNLKFTSSFYAFMLAVLTALIIRENHEQI